MKRLQISLAVLAVALSATVILFTWANRHSDPPADAPFFLTPVGLPILGVVVLAVLSFTTWIGLMLVAGAVEWTVGQVREIAMARGHGTGDLRRWPFYARMAAPYAEPSPFYIPPTGISGRR